MKGEIIMCPFGTFGYRVKTGDTMWKIARMYNVSTLALMNANPRINPNRLQVGQIICVPQRK